LQRRDDAGGRPDRLARPRADRPGKEQPVDLEDWSAHETVTAASLAPGENLETDWPIRLIQSGTYRVVVSVTRDSVGLTASPFADFTVCQKPVVESQRVLPVVFGIPLVLGGLLPGARRAAAALLGSFSYERVLERGFALVQDRLGHVVTSVKALGPRLQVSLRFADGKAGATIDGDASATRATRRSDADQGTLL
jgi:hypothetical protein